MNWPIISLVEGFPLVDASNAFNLLNYAVALLEYSTFMHVHFLHCSYVLVISQNEYGIFAITQDEFKC